MLLAADTHTGGAAATGRTSNGGGNGSTAMKPASSLYDSIYDDDVVGCCRCHSVSIC